MYVINIYAHEEKSTRARVLKKSVVSITSGEGSRRVMIFYITQGLAEKFNVAMVDNLPEEEKVPALHLVNTRKWDHLTAWGIKGFNFRGFDCIQILNFASKLAFFAFNVPNGSQELLGKIMWEYLAMLYGDDAEMMQALERFFNMNRYTVYAPLEEKSALASLGSNEKVFTNEAKMATYIDDGVLLTKQLNYEYNKGYMVARTVRGRTEFIVPADRFKGLVMERYGEETEK